MFFEPANHADVRDAAGAAAAERDAHGGPRFLRGAGDGEGRRRTATSVRSLNFGEVTDRCRGKTGANRGRSCAIE